MARYVRWCTEGHLNSTGRCFDIGNTVQSALQRFRDSGDPWRGSSGYVVQSLEAALWCFQRTSTFEDAILKAAKLGDDADTTAAVCGQIAGAFYGIHGIPERWLRILARRELIEDMAGRLAEGREKLRT